MQPLEVEIALNNHKLRVMQKLLHELQASGGSAIGWSHLPHHCDRLLFLNTRDEFGHPLNRLARNDRHLFDAVLTEHPKQVIDQQLSSHRKPQESPLSWCTFHNNCFRDVTDHIPQTTTADIHSLSTQYAIFLPVRHAARSGEANPTTVLEDPKAAPNFVSPLPNIR